MTDVDIANAALALVKKAGIATLGDNTATARACNALYAPARDKVLEDRIWSFAKKQYILSVPGATPTFGWSYQFPLAVEVIAPITVNDADDNPVAYEVQGRVILSNEPVLHLTAKTKVTDTTTFTPGFCTTLTFLLAAYLAVPLAENRELQAQYDAEYRKALKDAAGADGAKQASTGKRPSDLKARRLGVF